MATIESVTGPIEADDLGPTLIHEHYRARDESNAAQFPHLYDEEALEAAAIEAASAALERGVKTIGEPTAMMLGRDIAFIERVARETGLQTIACTGIYTYDHLPLFWLSRDADVMADAFVHDIEEGIQGTSIKAAFLKCAADAPGVTDNVEKIHRACATGEPAHRRADHGPLAAGVQHRAAPGRDLPRGGGRPVEDPDRAHRRHRRPRLHRGPAREGRLHRSGPVRDRDVPADGEADRHDARAARARLCGATVPVGRLVRVARLVPRGDGGAVHRARAR